jgi:hypothetical protein
MFFGNCKEYGGWEQGKDMEGREQGRETDTEGNRYGGKQIRRETDTEGRDAGKRDRIWSHGS